jgi:hypothetical protein
VIAAPIPIGLPIPVPEPIKIVVLAMILLDPHPIGSILAIVPFVFIMMSSVTITPGVVASLLFPPLIIPTILAQGYGVRKRHQEGNA